MGNTNSMNNMSLLDQKRYQAEFLRYSQIPYDSQYLQQQPQSIHASNMNLHQINKYKDQHPLSNPVKVLPDVKFEPKLRTTNNGAILSSGGTISGRKDSECGLHRSKSISETQNTYLSNPNGMPAPPPQFRMQRASTQLSINLQNPSRLSNVNKNFGSSHDLNKNNPDAKNNHIDRRPMDNKNHRDIRKSRAPPPPMTNANNSNSNNNSNNRIKMTPPPTMQAPEPPTSKVKSKAPMAQRMFGDTLKNGKNLQLAKVKQKIESDIAIKPKEVTKTSVTKVIPAPTQSKPAQIIPKVNPTSYLRRERTFDMTLMQTENKEKFRPKFSPQFQRKMNGNEPLLRPVVEQRQMTTQERYRASVGMRPNNNNGFQSELQSATKLKRSTAITASDKTKIMEKKPLKKMPTMPLPSEPSPPSPPQMKFHANLQKQPIEKKKSDNSAISNPTMSANSSFKFSKPVSKEPEIIQFHRHGEEIELPVTRHEQILTPKDDVHGNMNNFYFGMNEASVDTDEDDDLDNNSDHRNDVEAAQMDAINKFAENIFKMSSGGSSHMPQSQAESIISDREFDSDSSDILLSLRPTLPRRQLQIPRFSPVAAWKSLANESNMLDSRNNKISSSLLQLQEEASKHETKIERIYREPSFNLHHLDNKSGDSGISADKEMGGNNSPDGQMPTAYLMSSWTPQQDLEEDEEESVDGDEKESYHHHDNDKSQPFIATNGHMFSLSLPRDNFSVSDKGQPQNNFYTLQKFRKTAAEVFANTNINNEGKIQIQNYAGDSNWLLSSQPNSIDDYSPRKEGERNQIISQMTKGKHVMYLPTNFDSENHRYESTINVNHNHNHNDDMDDSPRYKFIEIKNPPKSKSKGKFKFQSTIRQVERRKIAEKLSREAEQKEMHRLGEFEAMQKVEEEFQRKRAREKNLIKQQLRIASMEDDDFEPQNYFNFNHLSKAHYGDNDDDEIDTRTPYISRIIEAKSPRVTVSQYKSS